MKNPLRLFSSSAVCMPLTNISGIHVTKYRAFKTLLDHNRAALNAMAALEQLYHSGKPFSLASVRPAYEALIEAAYGVIHALTSLTGKRSEALEKLVAAIDTSMAEEMKADFVYPSTDLALPFDRISGDLTLMVGAKAGNLARIRNEADLPVPDGFAVTAYAFQRLIDDNGLGDPIERALALISLDDMAATEATCSGLQTMIRNAVIPEDVREAIARAYTGLRERVGKEVRVAMRSSAVGEDTEATFAGQYATVLNVDGENIIDAYKTVIASKYSAKAVSYRLRYGLSDSATPMAVACVVMIDPVASGVVYTADSLSGLKTVMRVTSLWGLAERLVNGSAPSDSFAVDRNSLAIIRKEISRKEHRLVAPETGGTRLDQVAEADQETPSLDDADIIRLCEYGLRLEDYFGAPQDIEWALDSGRNLSVLQSRPLSMQEKAGHSEPAADLSGATVLMSQGKTASPGIAIGRVFIVRGPEDMDTVPDDSILVARTASPDYARLAGKVRGIITDTGSVAGHLASVAREFGIPLVVDSRDATSRLVHSDEITLSADTATIYRGVIGELLRDMRPVRQHTFESPVHRAFKKVLDLISPLTLTDPHDSSFSAEGCRTLHDVVRFTHEKGVKAMFGITDETQEVRSIELSAKVPLALRLIDLGGGLSQGLTTCHVVTPEHIESVPLKALWKGFTHPGISWEGAMPVDARKLLTLFAAGAAAEVGETLAGTSYAIISGEYMNLSARFGYHFATIDALCGKDDNQNYISLQFAGGAGNYYGRSLRVSFLGSVLARSGFQTSIKGDLIEASLNGYDEASTRDKLDHLGRLMASSRLLDMTISGQADVQRLTEAFFRGEYDLLAQKREDRPRNFYTHGGEWKRVTADGRTVCMQDGSRAGLGISSGVAGVAGKLMGQALQDFLDNIEAYYYFPLAIARDIEVGDAMVRVLVKPVSGNIDRAGGIAFGIRDVSNYFVLRINALEDNVILFEYVNSRRLQRASLKKTIPSGVWQEVAVRISGNEVKGFLDGREVIAYAASQPPQGLVGLWTKADSVTLFDRMTIETEAGKKTIEW